jgi:hypothetical protein
VLWVVGGLQKVSRVLRVSLNGNTKGIHAFYSISSAFFLCPVVAMGMLIISNSTSTVTHITPDLTFSPFFARTLKILQVKAAAGAAHGIIKRSFPLWFTRRTSIKRTF